MDIPPLSPPPGAPPPPPSAGPQFPKIPLDLDPRTLATLKWSAIWNAVASAIVSVAAYISISFIGGFEGEILRAFGGSIVKQFPVGELIQSAIWGAVYGAIFGFFISKFYTQIQQWNHQYLKGWLNTFFKLLFYPSLVLSLLFFLLGSVIRFDTAFLINLAGFVVGSFVYAKMMTQSVGSLYPPPV